MKWRGHSGHYICLGCGIGSTHRVLCSPHRSPTFWNRSSSSGSSLQPTKAARYDKLCFNTHPTPYLYLHLPSMQNARFIVRRIPPLRPLRPPSRVFTTSRPHTFFARNATTRPQLPFLSRTILLRQPRNVLSIRPISTETRDWVVYQLKLGAYWTIMLWIAVGGATIGYFVLHQDWLDRLYPSPEDWPYVAKYAWRTAKHEEAQDAEKGEGLTDWAVVGNRYKNCFALLEEGALLKAYRTPLVQNSEWDRTIPGIDAEELAREPVSQLSQLERIGFDVSDKSEQWRRGYFEAMMGMAKASEMTADWVRDTTRGLSFPRDQVIGKSNPYPKPIWPGSPPAPLEENCKPVFDDPKLYYVRILTTKGFNRRQQIRAGLAYAAWLDFKGDISTADALDHWSLDLAAEGLPTEKPAKAISSSAASPISPAKTTNSAFVNSRTAVIPSTSPYTTDNLLLATTAYAAHVARYGTATTANPTSTAPAGTTTANPLNALPIYLSVLRARKSAPASSPDSFYTPPKPDFSLTSVASISRWIRSLPFRPQMTPAVEPTGDEPYVRTAASDCEDAALMTYVGEILYASTLDTSSTRKGVIDSRRREALGWTRDAVRIAERGAADKRLDDDGRGRCLQCLGAGLENWHRMVGALAKDERDAQRSKAQSLLPGMGAAGATKDSLWDWRPWTWWNQDADKERKVEARHGGKPGIDPALLAEEGAAAGYAGALAAQNQGEWAKEDAMVSQRLQEFQEAKLMNQLNRHISAKSNWFVV